MTGDRGATPDTWREERQGADTCCCSAGARGCYTPHWASPESSRCTTLLWHLVLATGRLHKLTHSLHLWFSLPPGKTTAISSRRSGSLRHPGRTRNWWGLAAARPPAGRARRGRCRSTSTAEGRHRWVGFAVCLYNVACTLCTLPQQVVTAAHLHCHPTPVLATTPSLPDLPFFLVPQVARAKQQQQEASKGAVGGSQGGQPKPPHQRVPDTPESIFKQLPK